MTATTRKSFEQLRSSLGYGILGLAFVDNLGLDVPLATIGTLTEGRLVDLFIVFQTGDIKRNIRDVLAGRDEPDRFDAFFGAGWKDVAAKAESENLTADETTTRLLDFYARKLNRPWLQPHRPLAACHEEQHGRRSL
jgi:hypothetical protein